MATCAGGVGGATCAAAGVWEVAGIVAASSRAMARERIWSWPQVGGMKHRGRVSFATEPSYREADAAGISGGQQGNRSAGAGALLHDCGMQALPQFGVELVDFVLTGDEIGRASCRER